jgi:hypothetical protein
MGIEGRDRGAGVRDLGNRHTQGDIHASSLDGRYFADITHIHSSSKEKMES